MDKEQNTDLILNLQKLNDLLEETVTVVKDDRELAKKNYDFLYEKLTGDDWLSSEEAGGERELNQALKLVIESSNKLTKILDTISKIGIAKIKADTLKEIAAPRDERIVDLLDTEQKNKLLEDRQMSFIKNNNRYNSLDPNS